jgi:transposase
MKNSKHKARQRASVILQVRSGQISASEGARLLGISRKTYYQWEKRALKGMLQQLEEQAPGRPRKQTDSKLEAIRKKIARLEAQLKVANQTAQVRAILLSMRKKQEKGEVKKKKLKSTRS